MSAKVRRVGASMLVLAAVAAPAAEGNRLLGAGTAQLGTAGGGCASPWDSTWLVNNVAGLTHIPHRVDGAAEIIYAESTLTPKGGIANSDAGTLEDEVVVFAPHLTYARPLEGFGGTFGVGLYTVAGLEAEFDESRSLPGEAGGYDTYAIVGTTRLSTGYAREVGEGWSLGLALNLNYTTLEGDLMLADGSQTKGEGEVDGALGFGFQVALQKDYEDLSFALVYTSRQWMETFDKYDDLLVGSLDQPPVLQMGLAIRALPQLELLLDYRFINYSAVEAIASETQGFGWEDVSIVKLGTRWTVAEGATIHAGVSYGNSPIRDEDAFINGFSMLNNEWHLAAGFTWMATSRLEIGGALMHAPKVTNTDDGSKVFGLGEGTEISLEVTSLTLGIGYLL